MNAYSCWIFQRWRRCEFKRWKNGKYSGIITSIQNTFILFQSHSEGLINLDFFVCTGVIIYLTICKVSGWCVSGVSFFLKEKCVSEKLK